jgi:hypothetical protein
MNIFECNAESFDGGMADPYEGADFNEVDTHRRIILNQIDNIKFDDVDHKDYPDFCDAFVSSADMNGIEMSDEELYDLNENYGDFVHEKLIESLT